MTSSTALANEGLFELTLAHSDTLKFVGTLSDFFSEASYGKMHKTRKVFDFLRNFRNQIFLSLGTFLKILGSPFLG